MHVELSWQTRSCSGLARPRHATLPGRLLQRTCGSDLSLLLFLTLSSISTMQVSIKDLVTRDVLGQVVVEQESSVAFLKHRLWELQPESFPRCRQCLYDGDMELGMHTCLRTTGCNCLTSTLSTTKKSGMSRTVQDAPIVNRTSVQLVISTRSTAASCGLSHGRTAWSATKALLQQQSLQ